VRCSVYLGVRNCPYILLLFYGIDDDGERESELSVRGTPAINVFEAWATRQRQAKPVEDVPTSKTASQVSYKFTTASLASRS
jgi:hypothetical protein